MGFLEMAMPFLSSFILFGPKGLSLLNVFGGAVIPLWKWFCNDGMILDGGKAQFLYN